ncbi:ChbG/HpnK family deacetylase [Candidatus Roizmanbacteria bacterium]|nr:ChbG/HpnK family deacetylase [Candidatus Roizmanbacteria bacterium]
MIKFYSDDFGYDKKVDSGIIRLIKNDKLFGLSVLSTMVSSLSLHRLSNWIKPKYKFVLGLHINLIEGKPAQHRKKIKSLVGKNNQFFPLVIFLLRLLLGRVKKIHIQREIEAQLKKLQKAGFKVKMLDSHQHTLAFSPVAEITAEIAREKKIPLIRSFGSIKAYSLKAKFTFTLLKILAFLSYFISYKKIGLPASWEIKQELDWTVMSWEDNTFNVGSIKDKKAAIIIHPFLPFDSNRSYWRYIE